MTEGRDGISSAHQAAPRFTRVARQLSVVTAVLLIAALVAGTAGTSYAKSKKKKSSTAATLRDTVVVSNFGALFAGSIETFQAGSRSQTKPKYTIKGLRTNLSASTGASGDAVSSLDAHIAVTIPIDFLDLTGCGPFGQPATAPAYGTGLAEIFTPTSKGNTAPESVICSPNFAFGAPNTTGIFMPQGAAFEDPYDGIWPGTDILAVANALPEVYGPDEGEAACADGGVSLGTITEYNRLDPDFTPGLDNIAPFNNSPVDAINPFTSAFYTQNATIGGCVSLLAGPVGLTFDESGVLYVVNNAGNLAAPFAAAPRFVTVYQPGASGDVFPLAVLGYIDETAGDLIQPVAVTVESDPEDFFNDIIFVTDEGDNSIKIFAPFENFDIDNFFYAGELLGVIHGGNTKLKSPMGIALGADDDALYVVSNTRNSLEMFTDFDYSGGDIAPTLIVSGRPTKMNLPVGVALPVFTPAPTYTYTPTYTATDESTPTAAK